MDLEQASALSALRAEMDTVNHDLVKLLNQRAAIAGEIERVKANLGMVIHDPQREAEIIDRALMSNAGPLSNSRLRELLESILRVSRDHMSDTRRKRLHVSREAHPTDTIVELKGLRLGGGNRQLVVGPCAVESERQVEQVARVAAKLGIRLLRGGAFKPRTSPYSFEGLGAPALEILQRVAIRHNMITVSEVMDTADVMMMAERIDILQIGARNMSNFRLLDAVGRANVPVVLKRGMAATKDEWLLAAERIMHAGNSRVILCERGIRTYETATRNTLDLSTVALVKHESHLPVIVDVSHAAGRRELVLPLAQAALATGCDGVMLEVHPDPPTALSDPEQQLDLDQLTKVYAAIRRSLTTGRCGPADM